MSPGVYLFKDARGRIIYVGKASRLRNRVGSYFSPRSDSTPKLESLVGHITDFEFYITASEEEALVLESNLIKKFKPRYNISLKDDKSFPYLKIEPAEGYPRVVITRRAQQDGGRLFGPFSSASSVRVVLQLIKKVFPLRSCTRPMSGGKRTRPCLDYHIGRCLGPCTGSVTLEDYSRVVKQVSLFLEGKLDAVVRDLRRSMAEASRRLEFEKAGALRDQISAVERVIEQQQIAATVHGEQDVIAFARSGDIACVQIFFVRGGKLAGRERFTLQGTRDEEPPQIMSSFLKQFYASATSIPPMVLLQYEPDDVSTIKRWLGMWRGERVNVIVPQRGNRKRLVDTVAENARQEMEQRRVRDMADAETVSKALQGLKDVLELPEPPQWIECYDISNTSGKWAVGSMVVFEGGKPSPSHYRRFRISTVEGIDDYAMMREVLIRRFGRGGGRQDKEENGWRSSPDLVLIDGGKGHLGAALEVVPQTGKGSISVASIAKEKEEVFLPQRPEPILLPHDSAQLHLLQRIRDEAHRFAITYHRNVRSRESNRSLLSSIPGIGSKRRTALLRRFGSVNGLVKASVEEISSVEGMTRPAAERVKQYLGSYLL